MSSLKFILILTLLIGTVFLGCFAISATLIVLLPNLSAQLISWLWAVPLVLATLFIVVQFVGNKFYNPITRFLYTITAAWMGLFVYLLVATFVSSILITLGIGYIGIYFFGLALIASIYGIIHAKNMQIKELDITLENLPQQWKERKIVFVSDLHLGLIHGKSFAEKVVNKINSLNPDIIFIGGDLYDGSAAAIRSVTPPLKNLSSKFGTYFVLGNHEQFGESSPFISGAQSVGIKVLLEQVVDIEGLQIAGISHAHTDERDNFQNLLLKINIQREKPSILLNHEPRHIDITEKAGISLQFSGHTHRAQQWPLGYIPKKIFKGFDYGLKNSGKTQVYTSSGVGTWGPPLRVGTDSEIVLVTLK